MFSSLFNGALLRYVTSPVFLIVSLSLLIMTRKKTIVYPNPIPGAPRGVKNNNPGNLVRTFNQWKGKINPSSDPKFEQFTSMEYGARASMKNIQTWYNRGLTNLRKLITAWAPPSENDTENYIQFLSSRLGVSDNYHFQLTPAFLQELAYQISVMENGQTQYISRSTYQKAFEML
jgi:hypothetical protein